MEVGEPVVDVVAGGREQVVEETLLDGLDLVDDLISVGGPDLVDGPISAAVPDLAAAVQILVAAVQVLAVSDPSVARRRPRLVDWPRWTRQGTSC